MREKLKTSEKMQGIKASYPLSIQRPFKTDRLDPHLDSHPMKAQLQKVFTKFGGDSVRYIAPVTKFNRKDYKPNEWIIVISPSAVYLLEAAKFKLKMRLSFHELKRWVISKGFDNMLILETEMAHKKDKGDYILSVPDIIEMSMKFSAVSNKKIHIENQLVHHLKKKKNIEEFSITLQNG